MDNEWFLKDNYGPIFQKYTTIGFHFWSLHIHSSKLYWDNVVACFSSRVHLHILRYTCVCVCKIAKIVDCEGTLLKWSILSEQCQKRTVVYYVSQNSGSTNKRVWHQTSPPPIILLLCWEMVILQLNMK